MTALLQRETAGGTAALQQPTAPDVRALRGGALGGEAAWAYGLTIGALFVAAAIVGLQGLGLRFDLQAYDEGVYWESLRAMDRGLGLYRTVFDSQAPLFLLSLYPVFHLFGSTIAAARLALVAFSLLGLAGAFLSALLLAGRLGGLLALLLTLSPVLQQAVPRHLEAEGPAEALLLLGLAAALCWWRHPNGRAGLFAMFGFGVCVTMGVLIKLLDVTGYVLLALMLATALLRAARRREPLAPIVWGGAAALAASAFMALAVLLPFAPAWPELYRQAVQFHLAARLAYAGELASNARNIANQFLLPNAALCALALAGLFVAAWRRDSRAVFLGGWLLVSVLLLLGQAPLFGRHAIILLPPLVALATLGIAHAVDGIHLPAGNRGARWGLATLLTLVTVAVIGGFVGQAGFLAAETGISTRDAPVIEQMSGDLRTHVPVGGWVVTDQQLAAAGAGRDTPPWLVDTSWVRIDSGFLSVQELCAATADNRVAAVLFATGRLTSKRVAGFKACVEQQFNLYRTYDDRSTLWLRRR